MIYSSDLLSSPPPSSFYAIVIATPHTQHHKPKLASSLCLLEFWYSLYSHYRTVVTMKVSLFALTALWPATSVTMVSAYEDTCTQFKNIYTSGTDLCERMWDDAFTVVDDSQPGYTMWFFDQDNNPNDEVTRQLFPEVTSVDECHLQYFHKEVPSPEDDNMRECHPWKNNACCDSSTVKSVDAINEAYGDGYQWDRCGPISQACERFFVMEACLYECEPNAGLFRKFNDSQTDHPEFNTWQLHKMPIKKSFCDAWYTACYNDYFCGQGSYFQCAAYYEDNKASFEEKEDKALKIGLSVTGVVALLAICFAWCLIHREKKGQPLFLASTEGTSS